MQPRLTMIELRETQTELVEVPGARFKGRRIFIEEQRRPQVGEEFAKVWDRLIAMAYPAWKIDLE